jgi:hypothetical protein
LADDEFQRFVIAPWRPLKAQKADADPTAFAIVDGKLYLNYDKEVQADWGGDVVGNVAKADANWPTTSALGEVER